MLQRLAMIAAILLVVLSGVIQGIWTERWQASGARQEAASRLGRVPLTVGDWEGKDLSVDPQAFAQARLDGFLWRRYQNAVTGEVVSLLLVCGPPGPVAAHTPDLCYSGQGNEMLDQPGRRTYGTSSAAEPATFWSARFSRPSDPFGGQLRISWSFNARGAWTTPDSARWAFAGIPVLYKLYVLCDVRPAGLGQEEGDPAKAFLEVAIPEVDKALWSKAQPGLR
jgi:hypothetical protein